MAFVKRQINLSEHNDALVSLLKAKDLDVCLNAEDIITSAQQRAQQILDEAAAQAEQIRQLAQEEAEEQAFFMRQEVEQQAWRELNTLLAELNQQKEALWDDIEHSATAVLNDALQQFMGQTGLEEKAQLLVQQLVKVQRQAQKGTLVCSPVLQNAVNEALIKQGLQHWQVSADPMADQEEISLVTDMGSFRCSWQSICEQLTGAPEQENVSDLPTEL